MTVECPTCFTGYLLPDHLVGPAGARVRCPRCKTSFLVTPVVLEAGRAGEREVFGGNGHAAEPAHEPEPAPVPESVALAVIEQLIARRGDSIARARAERRLFRDHGAELMAAFDEYRRAAGTGAPAAAFRAALHVRLGVTLGTQPGVSET